MRSLGLLVALSSSLAAADEPVYLDCFLEVESKVTAVYRVALDETSEKAYLQQEGGLFYYIDEVDFAADQIDITIGEYLKRRFTIERSSLKFSHEIEHNVGVHRSDGECWPMEVSERL